MAEHKTTHSFMAVNITGPGGAAVKGAYYYSRGNKDVPETQKSAEKRPKHTSGHTSQAQKGGF